jgi:hypothetical protein
VIGAPPLHSDGDPQAAQQAAFFALILPAQLIGIGEVADATYIANATAGSETLVQTVESMEVTQNLKTAAQWAAPISTSVEGTFSSFATYMSDLALKVATQSGLISLEDSLGLQWGIVIQELKEDQEKLKKFLGLPCAQEKP